MLMTKKEAAEYLAVSVRAIERFTAKGRLSVEYRKGKRGRQAVYLASEVQALKLELTPAPAKPMLPVHTVYRINSPMPPVIYHHNDDRYALDETQALLDPIKADLIKLFSITASAFEQTIGMNLKEIGKKVTGRFDRLVGALEMITSPDRPPSLNDLNAKLTLTLPEATALSGLPQELLIKAIRSGRLKTIKIDSEMRIKRKMLDAFIADLT